MLGHARHVWHVSAEGNVAPEQRLTVKATKGVLHTSKSVLVHVAALQMDAVAEVEARRLTWARL